MQEKNSAEASYYAIRGHCYVELLTSLMEKLDSKNSSQTTSDLRTALSQAKSDFEIVLSMVKPSQNGKNSIGISFFAVQRNI